MNRTTYEESSHNTQQGTLWVTEKVKFTAKFILIGLNTNIGRVGN